MRALLLIAILLFPVYASADMLTTPISKTATTYAVTYVAFSLVGNVMTVDLELMAVDGTFLERKTIVCDQTCYPTTFAATLKTKVIERLKTLGVIN